MLTTAAFAVDPFIESLREREFGRLDRQGLAYLDYTGSALYAECQLRSHHALLANAVFGNPHSESEPSRASTMLVELARGLVLRHLDADPREYAVIFTANTSAAVRLVAEAYPFRNDGALVLSADNHNSINGIREYARLAGTPVAYVPLDAELRLHQPLDILVAAACRATGPGLFAFPGQSNFSGVQHRLDLIGDAQRLGFDVLLDAAALAPSNRISLRRHRPEFIALSFYKMFGYPTGVGALVARRDALTRLERPWFAGGTVDFASVQNDLHRLKTSAEGFEDGTPDFLNIAALPAGFAFLDEVGVDRIHDHVARLTSYFLDELESLTHCAGRPLVRVYGPRWNAARGGTVAFNILSHDGRTVPYAVVERRARDVGIALRGGCFCNPGAAEHAFGFDRERTRECLLGACDAPGGFTIDAFAERLGPDVAVGAVRASFGVANSLEDVSRAVALVGSFGD